MPLLFCAFTERKMLVAQLRLTLCDPMGCSLPGSSICGIFQARILEWAAISFSSGSSWSTAWTWVSGTAGRFLTVWATSALTEGRDYGSFGLKCNPGAQPSTDSCESILTNEWQRSSPTLLLSVRTQLYSLHSCKFLDLFMSPLCT